MPLLTELVIVLQAHFYKDLAPPGLIPVKGPQQPSNLAPSGAKSL